MIKGLHHISMIASSEKTIQFYGELGFQETFRETRAYDSVVFMDGYGMRLIIFVDPTHPPRDTNPEQLGVRNISLRVDDINEVAGKYGCGPIKKDWKGESYCLLKDPDGLVIEFHE